MAQIEKEIGQWRRRFLTPIGKITVIKSLLISKLVHLFTALPNPSKEEITTLERVLFSFLWAGKRDPIKRAKICLEYAQGGLSMIDIKSFANSMKLTWLKRVLFSEAEWAQMNAAEIPNMWDSLSYGTKKIQKICQKVNNPFWKNVLEAYALFSQLHDPEIPEILSECVWLSNYTKFKLSVINEWKTKGIRFLNDLVSEDTGQIHTKGSLENAYNIKMTFLCYNSIIRSLPEKVRLISVNKEIGPVLPLRINLVANHSNFPRLAYRAYVESKHNEVEKVNAKLKQKWIRDIGVYEDNSFSEVVSASISPRIRIFHYKLINRILATNRYLKIINVKDDDNCSFCRQTSETLANLYWHCPDVQIFLHAIRTDIILQYNINCNINIKNWFFPTEMQALETCVITLAKMVIYDARLKGTKPDIKHLKNKIKWEVEVEYNTAIRRNKQCL